MASGSDDKTIKLWNSASFALDLSNVYTYGSEVKLIGFGMRQIDRLLVLESASLACPNYGPGIDNSQAQTISNITFFGSSVAIAKLDSLRESWTYPVCYYISNRFYQPLGRYLAVPLGAVAVRDRPALALRVTSLDPRCRMDASGSTSGSTSGSPPAAVLLCPPGAANVTVRVVGRYVLAMGARQGEDALLAEGVRFGENRCTNLSAAASGLSAAEKAEWPDWNSTGVGAFTCRLPRGYGQRKPVYVDLRRAQQGLEPAYLLSYDACPLFSSPDDQLLEGGEGGACLCDRGYFAADQADWPRLQELGLLLPAQLQQDSLFAFRCASCPAGAQCVGERGGLAAEDLIAAPGYFHLNRSAAGDQLFRFEPCLTATAAGCSANGTGLYLGTQGAEASVRCANAFYTGPLCGKCQGPSYRTADFQCLPCQQSAWAAAGFLVAGAVAVWLLVALLSRGLFSRKSASASDRSVLIKICLNGALTASLVLRTSLPWPAWTAAVASSLQAAAGDGAGRLLSLDCLLASSQEAFMAKRILLLLLPLVLWAAAWMACLCASDRRCCRAFQCAPRGQRLSVRQQTRGSMVILLAFTYTTYCESSLSLLNCHALSTTEEQTLFLYDLDLVCWQGTHLVYVLAVALPGLLLWSLGLPALAARQIYRHRHTPPSAGSPRAASTTDQGIVLSNISQEQFPALEESPSSLPLSASSMLDASPASRSYGYLTRGYRAESYLWECAVLGRKVLLAAVVVLWREQGQVQLALISFLVSLATAAQFGARPFSSPRANRLESAWLLQAGCLALLGQLLFLARSEAQKTGLAAAVFLVLIANAAFTLATLLSPCRPSRFGLSSGSRLKQAKETLLRPQGRTVRDFN